MEKRRKLEKQFVINGEENHIVKCPGKCDAIKSWYENGVMSALFRSEGCSKCRYRKNCFKEAYNEELNLITIAYASERDYVLDVLKEGFRISTSNINSSINSNLLLTNRYLGEIVSKLMNIATSTNYFKKNNCVNIGNDELNEVERSFIFLDIETIKLHREYNNKISSRTWISLSNLFTVLYKFIEGGVKCNVVEAITIRLTEDYTIMDPVITYGEELKCGKVFNPNDICEEMLFYKRWNGEVYNSKNKIIKLTDDYTELIVNKLIKYPSLKSTHKYEEDSRTSGANYVNVLSEGVVLKRAGKFKEAQDKFTEAIEIDNKIPTAYYNLGKILYILGNYNASVRAYKLAFERDIEGFIKNMPIGVESFYINLGHSLIDEENRNDNKFKDIVFEYSEGIKGKSINKYINQSHKIAYEKKCIDAAEKFLKEFK